jgi:hypothetical protein
MPQLGRAIDQDYDDIREEEEEEGLNRPLPFLSPV